MLGLPQSSEVNRPLPKAQLFKRFDWKPSQRECFDGDVARLDFINWISPRTLPAIAEGDEVKELFVIEVSLKRRDFDTKSIILLAKSIPQRVIYALRYEDDVKIAVYHTKLFMTDWQYAEGMSLRLEGLNLDIVWENIVRQIGNVGTSLRDVGNTGNSGGSLQNNATQSKHAKGMSLREQIQLDEEHSKLMRQIESLERQMNATKQPRHKRELFLEIQQLKTIYGTRKK